MDQEILRIYGVEGNGNSSPEYLYNTAHARAQQARNELETYRSTLNT